MSAGLSGEDDQLGRVKDMGGSVAGRMRREREGRTDSLKRTCVAPESAMTGEGVIEHNREGEKSLHRRNRQISKRRRGRGGRNERLVWGVYSGGKKRKIGMREGGGCVERGKGLTRTVGDGVGDRLLS